MTKTLCGICYDLIEEIDEGEDKIIYGYDHCEDDMPYWVGK
jgi:predicted TIM-barrel fold metal-dependent hydrolase